MKSPVHAAALLGAALAAFLAGLDRPAGAAEAKNSIAYVGTYTRQGGKGISAFRFDSATGQLSPLGLAAAAKNPSFLAVGANGRFLYVSNEMTRTTGGEGPNGLGWVSAYELIPGDFHLRFINRQSAGGEGPAHIAVDAENRWVYIANYNSGSVAAFPLNPDGSLAPAAELLQDSGTGPRARQKGPHAHCVVLDPGEHFLYSCDLGADRVMIYRVGGAKAQLERADPPSAAVPPGSGPRHLALLPGTRTADVVNEIGSSVSVFAWSESEGRLTLRQTVSTLPSGWTGVNAAAELQLAPDGRFLYVSNRGQDSIAIFSIGTDGTLALDETVPSGGKTPRFLTLDPTGQFLLVADEGSDLLQVFRRDPATGGLAPLPGDVGHVSMPSCIVFVPDRPAN